MGKGRPILFGLCVGVQSHKINRVAEAFPMAMFISLVYKRASWIAKLNEVHLPARRWRVCTGTWRFERIESTKARKER